MKEETPIDLLALARKVAWLFVKQAPEQLQVEELVNEAFIGCMEALSSFDQTRGGMSTWAWHSAKRRLQRIIYNERKHGRSVELSQVPEPQVEQRSLWELLELMGEDARNVCRIIIENPEEFLKGRTQCKRLLTSILREQGWKHKRIQAAFCDIQQVMRVW